MIHSILGIALSLSLISFGSSSTQSQRIRLDKYNSLLPLQVESNKQVGSYFKSKSAFKVSTEYYSSNALPAIKELDSIELEKQKIQIEKDRVLLEEARKIEQDRLDNEARIIAEKKAKIVKVATPLFAPTTASGINTESLIRERCAQLGCNSEQIIKVMYCESGGRSDAYNASSGASGLFQFMPSTFAANAARIGISNSSIWDPYAQVMVATSMFANGQASQWSCKG